MTLTFEKNPEDLRNLAAYVAQLTKECVVFEMIDFPNRVKVTLTGGF